MNFDGDTPLSDGTLDALLKEARTTGRVVLRMHHDLTPGQREAAVQIVRDLLDRVGVSCAVIQVPA